MKKITLGLCMLFVSLATFAQCDKNLILTSSKTEYLDTAMAVQQSIDEKTVIEVSGSQVIITPGSEDHKMTGTITSKTCDWTTPFKEGKSIIKATLDGDEKNLTLTIEGKDGKVTLLAEIAEMPDRKIRVALDTFEEKK